MNILNIAISILLSTVFFVESVATQRIINPSFDKKVERMLTGDVPQISVAEASACTDQYYFLDARKRVEYDVSHLPQSTWIGYKSFDITRLDDLDRSTPIVVYCSIGYRSEKIGKKLMQAGFDEVYNLYGSIFEWVNQDHTVVDTSGKTTSRVHTYNKNWSRWVDGTKVTKVW